MKKLLIEVGHPGQVHQFRIIAQNLSKSGFKVHFVAKSKEITKDLLDNYQLEYSLLPRLKGGILSKLILIPKVYFTYFKLLKKFKPDIILSRFTLQSSHLAKLLGIYHIGFTDTEHVKMLDFLTIHFVNQKFTSFSYNKDLGKNHYRIPANIELYYLHPNHFNPDKSILKNLGVKEDEKFVILRFISWDAHHDIGHKGIGFIDKVNLVKELSKYAKVFISAEGELPNALKKYRIKIPPIKMHDAMAFAALYVGEGGTMATECGMLGTPNVLINPMAKLCGIHNDLMQNYKLQYYFDDLESAKETIYQLIKDKDAKTLWAKRRRYFLSKMIDPSNFITWFIENLPDSKQKIDKNKKYYNNYFN